MLGLTGVGRRRALDRAMDEALKKPTKRRFRKADGIVCFMFNVLGLLCGWVLIDIVRIWNKWPMPRLRICASA